MKPRRLHRETIVAIKLAVLLGAGMLWSSKKAAQHSRGSTEVHRLPAELRSEHVLIPGDPCGCDGAAIR